MKNSTKKAIKYPYQILAGVIILIIALVTGMFLSIIISYIFKDFIWQFMNIALFNSFIMGLGMASSAYVTWDLMFKIKNVYIIVLSNLLISGAAVAGFLLNLFYEPAIFLYYYNGIVSYLLIYFLFILALNALIIGFIFFYCTVSAKEAALNEEKILKQQTELKLLSSKLNPHFLFNSLNLIISLLKRPALAEDALINLTELLRYNLDHSEANRIPLKQELENVEKYLSIQKLRFEERLQYEIKISANSNIPPLIIQPLVENAIQHNIDQAEVLKIEIHALKEGNNIIIKILDSESRINSTMLDKGTGLTATKKRVENAGGSFNIKDGGIEITFDDD